MPAPLRVRTPAPVASTPFVLRETVIAPSPDAIAVVRAFVADVLREWGLQDSSDAAVLIASELATNAVRYARTPVVVAVGRRPDRIVLSVEDASPERATPSDPKLLDERGRGLQIVDAVAYRWGEVELERGKRVWAEIATRTRNPEPLGATSA